MTLATVHPLAAQTANLVKDINAVPFSGGLFSSKPTGLVTVGGLVFFAATDGTTYTELWKSDGTAEGTTLVKDINPVDSSYPAGLANLAGTLFFAANDGTSAGLWKSDGTEDGTLLVKALDLGYTPSPTALNGRLFFAATDGVAGFELWESDGSSDGTSLVADINPSGDSFPRDLVAVGGRLLFVATDASGASGLWRSDGTTGGTVLLMAFASGTEPHDLTAVGTSLFFGADDGTHGDELWASDGTTAGTQQVADINPPGGSHPSQLLGVNGTLFVAADDGASGNELWRSDGTAAGTLQVSDIAPGAPSSDPAGLASLAGVVYFAASASAGNASLWRSDGTAGGTSLLFDIIPSDITAWNGALYFSGCSVTDCHLWRSDGTPAGTQNIKAFVAPKELTPLGGFLVFSGADTDQGRELWRSDGTTDGTVLVTDIYHSTYGSQVSEIAELNGQAFFGANDGVHGFELWRSDGTEAGTVMVLDIVPGEGWSYPQSLTVVGDSLFFTVVVDDQHRALWKTDGTSGGTVRVKDFAFLNPGLAMLNLNGTLLFAALDEVNGWAVWRSDGTDSGTVLVKDLDPTGSTFPVLFPGGVVGGVAYFNASDGITGRELWRSDGTAEGTVLVKEIVPGPGDSSPYDMASIGSTLYFAAFDGVNRQLWKCDGTEAGTLLVKAICPPNVLYGIGELINFNGTLLFRADDGVHGSELWRSDGTEAGTTMVADIVPGPVSSAPSWFTVSGEAVLFWATTDQLHGTLWKTDGTPAGTVIVKDFVPGGMVEPSFLTDLNGMLYFQATDATHGSELWRSDGTADGTVLVRDIRPGVAGSKPHPLTAVGTRLFFIADDGQSGDELWTLNGNVANLGIVWSGGQASAVPGLPLTYQVVATNSGPKAANGAPVDHPLPASLLDPQWTCVASPGASCTPTGSGEIHDVVTLPVSGSVTYTLSATLDPASAGSLDTAAHVTPPAGMSDPTLANNAFSESQYLTPQADLTLTNSDGQTHATPGGAVAYTITASNHGPSDAPGSSLGDAFPSTITGVTWTCSASGGALCGNPSGSGDIADTASIPAGGGIAYLATGTIDPAATGTLANTASVSAHSGIADLEPSNNSATDVDNLTLPGLSELIHGSRRLGSLQAQPGPAETRSYFWITQPPRSSFEVVVDGVTGSISAGAGPDLDLLAADATTVVASSVPHGGGTSRSLRFENTSAAPRSDELVRVQSNGCTRDCGPDAQYRIRALETTYRVARFNNSGSQLTVLLLQNGASSTVAGHVWFWDASGASLGSTPFSLDPHRVAVVDTSSVAPSASGSLTVTHDGPYGALSGKAVAVEPATGFTFDTPLEPRR